MNEPKERPILFSGPMVRAILDGRKTQTRRVAKSERCPYGQPGDRLWVRETWKTEKHRLMPQYIYYRADYPHGAGTMWKPSIHMPRWASRITLEVTAVRCERLQDITNEDAVAEGKKVEPNGYSKYTARGSFAAMWRSFYNGSNSWEANPEVWVIEFKRVGDGR